MQEESSVIPTIRKNVLYLVREGFSREEVYTMPIPELYGYIDIINKEIDEKERRMRGDDSGSSGFVSDYQNIQSQIGSELSFRN